MFTERRGRAASARRPERRDLFRSLGLLGIIVATASVVFWVAPASSHGLHAGALRDGRVWVWFTHVFFHIDRWHLMLDLGSIVLAGAMLTVVLSWRQFAGLVIALFVLIPLGPLLYMPDRALVGLSGLQNGLMGALVPGLWRARMHALSIGLLAVACLKLVGESMGLSVGVELYAAAPRPSGGVAFAGHLTAFVIGFLFVLSERATEMPRS